MNIGSSREHDLVFHIGSGSVSGSLVLLQKGNKPTIELTYTSEFPVKENLTSDVLATHMLSALHTIVARLWHEHKKSIKTVHVVFASPWFSSFSKSITVKKEEPFTVYQKTVEKLVNEQITLMFKDVSKGDSVIIESAPSHMRINGYEVLNPYGKTASSLDISVYASMAPKVLCEEIETEIYTIVHPKGVRFHTFPFVAWNVVNPFFSPREDFILIDIGGEITDLLLVHRGAISSLASFPVGKNHFIRKTALHFECQPELADSLINLYATDMAENSVRERIETLARAFGQEWGIRLEQAVSGLKNDHVLPQKAFFVTDSNVTEIFEHMIRGHITSPTLLSHENLAQFIAFGKNEMPNVFIALDTIYLNHAYADDFIYKPEQLPVK